MGWVAALRPHLEREIDLELVGAEPPSRPEADLHLYHVADDPAHGFVYRALVQQPGALVLEEWRLHRLVHAETAGRGDLGAYLREARRAHGEMGSFVARQVLRGLGGGLASLLAMNDRVLEASLGLVATSEAVRACAAGRLPDRPVVRLPLAFAGASVLPGRREARAAIGLEPERSVVVAVRPADDTAPPERIARALGRLCEAEPYLTALWTAHDDPRRRTRLGAADVVVALEHPVRSGLAPAVVEAVAAGLPTLVTAGSGGAREFPEGVVVPVSPGRTEGEEVEALVRRLLADPPLRERVGRLARTHAAGRRRPAQTARDLVAFVRGLAASGKAALEAITADRSMEGTLLGGAIGELRWSARELGLTALPPGLAPLVEGLLGAAR
jgi:glycosyltransferase involved in cell wall biosynthesis